MFSTSRPSTRQRISQVSISHASFPAGLQNHDADHAVVAEDVRQAYLQGETVWVVLHLGRKSGSKPCSIYRLARRCAKIECSGIRLVMYSMAQCARKKTLKYFVASRLAKRRSQRTSRTLAIPLKG